MSNILNTEGNIHATINTDANIKGMLSIGSNGASLSEEQVTNLGKIPMIENKVIELDGNVTTLGSNVSTLGTKVTTLESKAKTTLSETQFNKLTDQIDYVDLIQKNCNFQDTCLEFIQDGLNKFTIHEKISETEGIGYTFVKNQQDDFIILQEGFKGPLTETGDVIVDRLNATTNGTFKTGNPPNYYTATVGDTITCDFTGTRLDFKYYINSTGGLWHFVIDEGTENEDSKDVSTFGNSKTLEITLFDNLEYASHTVVGTFIGADPDNPIDAPRGWFYHGGVKDPSDTTRTFTVYRNTDSGVFKVSNANATNILYPNSNKEFAFRIKKSDTNHDPKWIPQHEGMGSAFAVSPAKIIVNGVELENFTAGTVIPNVRTFQLIQHVHGVHAEDPQTPLVDIMANVTFINGVINMNGRLKFLEESQIHTGYCVMLPYTKQFGEYMKSSFKNIYTLNSSGNNEYIPEQGDAKSYVVLNANNDELKNYIVAIRYNSINETNRKGQDGRPSNMAFIQHRDEDMGKFYVKQYANHIVPKGHVQYYDGDIAIGKFDGATDYFL